MSGLVLTCPHDEHHHDDDELPRPQLGGLAHFFHRHLVWGSQGGDRFNLMLLRADYDLNLELVLFCIVVVTRWRNQRHHLSLDDLLPSRLCSFIGVHN